MANVLTFVPRGCRYMNATEAMVKNATDEVIRTRANLTSELDEAKRGLSAGTVALENVQELEQLCGEAEKMLAEVEDMTSDDIDWGAL